MDTFLRPSDKIGGGLLIKTSSVQKPKVVGFYSSNKQSNTEDKIRLDASNCKYLKRDVLTEQIFQIDLNKNEDLRKDYEQNHRKYSRLCNPMELFLEYLQKFVAKETFVKCSENKLFYVDVICTFQVLTKLMMVHGDVQEKFTLYCTKYKGNIYIYKGGISSGNPKTRKYKNYITRHELYAKVRTLNIRK